MDIISKIRAIGSYLCRSICAQILLYLDYDTCQSWAIRTSLCGYYNIQHLWIDRLTLSLACDLRRCQHLSTFCAEWRAQMYCAAQNDRRKSSALRTVRDTNLLRYIEWVMWIQIIFVHNTVYLRRSMYAQALACACIYGEIYAGGDLCVGFDANTFYSGICCSANNCAYLYMCRWLHKYLRQLYYLVRSIRGHLMMQMFGADVWRRCLA